MVSNIKSRYYSAHEFQSLEFKDSLNIFHSNFNGLAHKFDQLHFFLNSNKNDFDIINVSEISQLINQNFFTNISLDGFKTPFFNASKSSKGGGGGAIFVKDNLKVEGGGGCYLCQG